MAAVQTSWEQEDSQQRAAVPWLPAFAALSPSSVAVAAVAVVVAYQKTLLAGKSGTAAVLHITCC